MPDDNQFASGGFGPIFFSMIKEAAKKIPNKASGQQMFNTIKNTQGVKQSELKWTGLDDFLKDKKSVTKEEVKEFLQNNSLDVTEVKFSKNLKPNKELQKLIDDFEPKYIDERTNAPNYDVYETFIGKSADNRARGTMDFQTLKSVIGDDVVPESFEVVAEKFNAPKVLRYKNLNYDDPNILLRPSNDDFFITPIELEKYKIERIRRMKNMNTGGVKFEAQTEAGGKDYTELVFRLKVGGQDIGIPVEVSGQKAGDMITRKSLVPYKNPAHFNVKNEIAHVRFKTRYLEDVKPLKTILEASRKNLPLEPNKNLKVLSVEEMQSDFAIAARKGFQNNPDAKLMDFPYKNNWYELTIKRLLRYAADNNFDAVAIPKGSVAAKRYGETIGKA